MLSRKGVDYRTLMALSGKGLFNYHDNKCRSKRAAAMHFSVIAIVFWCTLCRRNKASLIPLTGIGS